MTTAIGRGSALPGRLAAAAGLIVLLTAASPRPAADEALVVDLSNHLVAITTGFAGASLLLFGAVEGDGDVVVVVRGPPGTEKIRRKERVMGLWVNRAEASVGQAPAFLALAATRPPAEILPAALLDRYQIGPEHLTLEIVRKDDLARQADYRAALLRLKRQAGLYAAQVTPISFVGRRLFRAEVNFPANLPTGSYDVEVYLVRDGQVAALETTPLIVDKRGVAAEIFDFAHQMAAFYGLAAIILAAFAGWLAALIFRRT